MSMFMTPMCVAVSVLGITKLCKSNLSENITIMGMICITAIAIASMIALYLLDKRVLEEDK